jgi:hypothetical protein
VYVASEGYYVVITTNTHVMRMIRLEKYRDVYWDVGVIARGRCGGGRSMGLLSVASL